jgi:hypothetical protein
MWLEVIHLRVAAREGDRMLPILRQLIDEISEKEHCGTVKLFRRAHIETDVCLHLQHDSDQESAGGSPVGVRLAAALKPFGMVNHTVWLADEQAASR